MNHRARPTERVDVLKLVLHGCVHTILLPRDTGGVSSNTMVAPLPDVVRVCTLLGHHLALVDGQVLISEVVVHDLLTVLGRLCSIGTCVRHAHGAVVATWRQIIAS